MFKDKKEELHRLEEELLLEAEREEAEAQLEAELEEAEALLDDEGDYGQTTEETYYNYSNRYGKVKAYNNDHADTDLDAYSDSVYAGKKRGISGLTVLALCLLTGIAVVLGWLVLKYKGII